MSGRRQGGSERRGGALLAVLWLSAALTAIAFSVAVSVRGEIARAETSLDGLKEYYLASGALERALLYMLWGGGARNPDGTARYWERGQPVIRLPFPTGEAIVEIVPEGAKLNVNTITQLELSRLLQALGLDALRVQQVTEAIIDWRSPAPGGQSLFDAEYLGRFPSFRAPHASLEQIEELLLVRGVTPDLFYGRYDRTPDGGLIPRAGLRDCLTVYPSPTPLDINSAEPEVMRAVGVDPQGIETVRTLRMRAPIRPQQFGSLAPVLGPAFSRFGIGGSNTYTLRATARLNRPDGKLSDSRRSVAMTVVLRQSEDPELYQVLRWYDNAAGRPLRYEIWSH
ncbi:MAG: general secretion pathway protein GspK [Bryobacterales bacterium]|nr:general secretion pathway protein GspK [Bryobacterales bacterium]